MKKLLLGSISLLLFSVSIFIFQVSCQKTVTAQQNNSTYILQPATQTTLGGIIVGDGLQVTSNGTVSVKATSTSGFNKLSKIVYRRTSSDGSIDEIWLANYDGSEQTKINITLPSGIVFGESMQPRLAPDGSKVFFTAAPSTSFSSEDLYSANTDGSNVTKIVDKQGDHFSLTLGGAY